MSREACRRRRRCGLRNARGTDGVLLWSGEKGFLARRDLCVLWWRDDVCFREAWAVLRRGMDARAGAGGRWSPRERGWGGGASREGPRRAVITPHERQYHVGFLLHVVPRLNIFVGYWASLFCWEARTVNEQVCPRSPALLPKQSTATYPGDNERSCSGKGLLLRC